MSEKNVPSNPRRARSLKFWVPALLGTLLLLWLLHPLALSWAARKGLAAWASANSLSISAEKLVVRLDGPVRLEAVKIRSLPGTGLATALDIASLEWHWSGIGALFSDDDGFVRDLTVKGLSGIWDLSPTGTPGQPLPLVYPKRWLPSEISLDVPALDLLWKNQKWMLRDLALTLSERATGQMDLGGISFLLDGYSKSLGPISARTAWKNGTFWLAAMELAPGLTVDNASVDLLHDKGPKLSLTAAAFEGSLRADLMFDNSAQILDAATWASNIRLDQLAALVGVPGEIAGKLAEGRFTYRGRFDRPADAEASLRLIAAGFQWNKRGWESLVVGASLIHRRLVVTEFDLRQKENSVNFNGEISLAEGWSQISKSPFVINVRADLRELGALAGLLGGPLDEASGRMTAAGAVTGHPGELEGFLNIEASDLTFRSLPPGSLRMEAVFRKNELEIVDCDFFSKKDTASLRGTVGIGSPHQYAANLDARIADVAVYLAPFHAPGAEQVYGGLLDVRWEGDGNWKSHSGAFDLKLRDFVAGITPAGITGQFTGTYSPQNLYFSKLQIENGPLRLDSHTTIASSGITVKDLELKSGNTPLLEGSLFVPIDLFAVVGGKDWRAAIDPEREAYLRLATPKPLSLRSLLDLAGQNAPLDGQVRMNLEAGGPPARLTATGDVSAENLRWNLAHAKVPASSLAAKFAAADGAATLKGTLETKSLPPVTVAAEMPFGLMRSESGDWQWMNPTGTFSAWLDFPKTDLAVFRPFLPDFQRLSGSLAGRLDFSGTVGSPQTNGKIEWHDGALAWPNRMPPIEKTEALIAFDGQALRVERFRGEMGSGPFEITGAIGLTNPADPKWDLRFEGRNILFAKSPTLTIPANVELKIHADNAGGSVAGSAHLADARISKRLKITPLLQTPDDLPQVAAFQPPTAEKGGPFAGWTLDVKIDSAAPILIPGTIAPGRILPDLTLQGTLSAPVPVGRITLSDVQAFLPAATLNIAEGHMDFLPDAPWNPLLDVQGTVQTPDFIIRANAFGPLNERKLLLRSEPPLTQESIVLLLRTGNPGGGRMSKPDPFSLPSFAKQFEQPTLSPDSFLNRLLDQEISNDLLASQAEKCSSFLQPADGCLRPKPEGFSTAPVDPSYTWEFR